MHLNTMQHALQHLGNKPAASIEGHRHSLGRARLAAKQQAEPIRQRAEAPRLEVVALHCLSSGKGRLPATSLRQPCVQPAACKLLHRIHAVMHRIDAVNMRIRGRAEEVRT